uniref:Uncharacterized protein n=1 Tax=Rhizophora mucronata TaxID=61149 RepID=A0A2P2J1K0_RHIMU
MTLWVRLAYRAPLLYANSFVILFVIYVQSCI